jgi:hypothetical protein
MLEAIAGVLLLAAPVPDPAKEALAHATEHAPPPCAECRDTCAPPPQQKCRDLCAAGKVQACAAIALATNDAKLLEDAAAKHDRGAEAALAKVDAARAPQLLGEACGLDYWPACATLAAGYEKKDPKFAIDLHTRACHGGFANECVAAAKLDKVNAKKLNQAACDLGLTDACPKQAAPKKKAP